MNSQGRLPQFGRLAAITVKKARSRGSLASRHSSSAACVCVCVSGGGGRGRRRRPRRRPERSSGGACASVLQRARTHLASPNTAPSTTCSTASTIRGYSVTRFCGVTAPTMLDHISAGIRQCQLTELTAASAWRSRLRRAASHAPHAMTSSTCATACRETLTLGHTPPAALAALAAAMLAHPHTSQPDAAAAAYAVLWCATDHVYVCV
jgi:hypothetical protein